VAVESVGVGGGEAHGVADGGVGEETVVGGECGVCDGPLTEREVDGFVVFPAVRVGSVVHLNFEVLGAAEEEVAVVTELAAVGARVVVDDAVGGGGVWDHLLGDESVVSTGC